MIMCLSGGCFRRKPTVRRASEGSTLTSATLSCWRPSRDRRRVEARENNPTPVADFLMRCLFTMFAEDVDLIPKGSFTELLENLRDDPDNFAPALSALWAGMDSGGYVGVLGKVGTTVKKFNG